MHLTSKKESFLLMIGDFVILYISLWLVLFLRYQSMPTSEIIDLHLAPFTLLFCVWVTVFFIAGLYEKRFDLSNALSAFLISKIQIINSIIAVLFFYFIPLMSITPRLNLFLYIFVSIPLLALWRYYSFAIYSKKQILACMIAGTEDAKLLSDVTKRVSTFKIAQFLNLDSKTDDTASFIEYVKREKIKYLILDSRDERIAPFLPALYDLVFFGVQFVEVGDIYESFYGKISLQLVKYGWFLEHVKSKPHELYDLFKRIMDICISIGLLILTLPIYVLVFIAIKIDDKGPVLYRDVRVGKDNKKITILKFRSMTVEIIPEIGKKRETRVGKFMRKTRIDELPQLINVLKGELSLIGPRPEQPEIVKQYIQSIPFYGVRHLITPGLSGWAQIYHEFHPHHTVDVDATKEKLSYDLYYIKNRSILLDIMIALKTLKTIFLSKGR